MFIVFFKQTFILTHSLDLHLSENLALVLIGTLNSVTNRVGILMNDRGLWCTVSE